MSLYFSLVTITTVGYGDITPVTRVARAFANLEAVDYFSRALAIKRRAFGESHSKLTSTYQCIGDVYYQKKEYAEALARYRQALELWTRSMGAKLRPGRFRSVGAFRPR